MKIKNLFNDFSAMNFPKDNEERVFNDAQTRRCEICDGQKY